MPFEQDDLFGRSREPWALPKDYQPRPVPFFEPERIILSKGSLSTPERECFVRRICAAYPKAPVETRLDVPHNKIDLGETDPVRLHRKGKRTLVFGELKTAVRFSEEAGNTCPNYWHFSVYGYCPFGCTYCYLAGTQGTWFSPTVKIYVNVPDVLAEIDRQARQRGRPTAFYLGKLQDGLALDPLTGYSGVLVPFFAQHPYARQVILTKSDSVDNLLKLHHGQNTVLSWSLNPPAISAEFEANVPSVEQRINAMRRCADQGYPVRAVIMPVIPHENWERLYTDFIRELVSMVPLQRLTVGGICIYRHARFLMEHHLGTGNVISRAISDRHASEDGRARYTPERRATLYRRLIAAARAVSPGLEIALCLEEPAVWRMVGLTQRVGRCNCVL